MIQNLIKQNWCQVEVFSKFLSTAMESGDYKQAE